MTSLTDVRLSTKLALLIQCGLPVVSSPADRECNAKYRSGGEAGEREGEGWGRGRGKGGGRAGERDGWRNSTFTVSRKPVNEGCWQ